MSTRMLARLTIVPALVLSLASANAAQSANARFGTYEKDGQTYFALSLLPQIAADPSQQNEVVILVDTSASQAGRYRAEGMTTLQSLLGTLGATDRVQLMAVDGNATPLGAGFVAPQGPQMQAAMSKLTGRTPLGATDLEAGLRAAAASFTNEGRARRVIYIGDAMSKANMPTDATFSALVNDLRRAQVSVSGYVVGREAHVHLTGALANETGGVVLSEGAELSGARAGGLLAASVHASVVWPDTFVLPRTMTSVYPTEMPPLRSDRDSIL